MQALFQSAQHIYEKKGRIRIRIRTSDLRIRIREAQKLEDPDPQHWITAIPAYVFVMHGHVAGTISKQEARAALREHKGNIWAAVTECVETRQTKVLLLPHC